MNRDDINNLAPLLLLAVRQLDAAMLDASAEDERQIFDALVLKGVGEAKRDSSQDAPPGSVELF